MVNRMRRELKETEKLFQMPEVQQAMALRCKEQGHDWRNELTPYLNVAQTCRWCGAQRW